MANDSENPNIPIVGFSNSPWADSISTVPTMGPVHENDTNTKVKAIKKIPISPPLSAFLFILFTNEVGSTISNAPKNEKQKYRI